MKPAFATPGFLTPSSIADGRARHGIKDDDGDVIEDGGYVRFDVAFRDTACPASSTIYLLDQGSVRDDLSAQRAAVEAARRAWLADKAAAHRNDRVSIPSPASAVTDASPRSIRNGECSKRSIALAREAWLADKQTAYRLSGR